MLRISHLVIAITLLFTAVLMPACTASHSAAQAKIGDTVQVNYTGKLADGVVFGTTAGRAPLEFKLGASDMIPGFEKAVLGMKVGEKKTVTVPANEAYGPHRDELVLEVPREKIPSGITPEVGQILRVPLSSGGTTAVMVIKVTDTTVTVDTNHPLAGQDLTFEIELIKIE